MKKCKWLIPGVPIHKKELPKGPFTLTLDSDWFTPGELIYGNYKNGNITVGEPNGIDDVIFGTAKTSNSIECTIIKT